MRDALHAQLPGTRSRAKLSARVGHSFRDRGIPVKAARISSEDLQPQPLCIEETCCPNYRLDHSTCPNRANSSRGTGNPKMLSGSSIALLRPCLGLKCQLEVATTTTAAAHPGDMATECIYTFKMGPAPCGTRCPLTVASHTLTARCCPRRMLCHCSMLPPTLTQLLLGLAFLHNNKNISSSSSSSSSSSKPLQRELAAHTSNISGRNQGPDSIRLKQSMWISFPTFLFDQVYLRCTQKQARQANPLR